ncbi:MAG: FecR domain-containing protein, partial [Deltaproteobacteria bacterium]|nr:FecR domain-containing protein [Deltaproteobacteria bacterium]
AHGFAFTSRGGSVGCDGAQVAAGVLPVGGVLDTGGHRAALAIADIGSAELGSNTRVRLDRTSAARHELFLERGHMHAFVSAPPRMFAVATPSAQVVDLGCEYKLDVDERGAGAIEVLTGLVELELGGGRAVVVPAGARARLLPGRRASLPLVTGASGAIVAAVRAYEANSPDAIPRVLAAATRSDAITLVNLARLAPSTEQRPILERLQEVFPAPQETTVEEALADRELFEMWFDEIVLVHVMAAAQQP